MGNANLKGTVTQNQVPTADDNDFVLQNPAGEVILVVKNPEGPGSTVHVLPTEDSYTSSQEAQSVEDTLKDRYFSNYDY